MSFGLKLKIQIPVESFHWPNLTGYEQFTGHWSWTLILDNLKFTI